MLTGDEVNDMIEEEMEAYEEWLDMGMPDTLPAGDIGVYVVPDGDFSSRYYRGV